MPLRIHSPRLNGYGPTAAMIAAALALAGCATPPDQIAPAYTSPAAYAGLSCGQLNAEAVRLDARLGSATEQQAAQADSDATTAAIALLLFWPAAMMLGGNDQAPAIAQLRGDAEAVANAAGLRGC